MEAMIWEDKAIEPWKDKAHRIVSDLCLKAHRVANKGKKRYVPYSVPEDAEELLRCLRENDEETAKAIFIRMAVIK